MGRFQKTYMVKAEVNIIKGKGPKSKIGTKKGSKSRHKKGPKSNWHKGGPVQDQHKGMGFEPVFLPTNARFHQRRIHCKTV